MLKKWKIGVGEDAEQLGPSYFADGETATQKTPRRPSKG